MNTSVRSTGCNSLFIWINGFTNSLLPKAIDVLERKTSVRNLFFSTDAYWPAALLKRDFGTAFFQSVLRNPQNTPRWRFPVLMQRIAYNAVTLHYQNPKNEVSKILFWRRIKDGKVLGVKILKFESILWVISLPSYFFPCLLWR